MLFVTNGDSAAGRIEQTGLRGEVLPWRDVLHEGPVPSGLSPDELREVRARSVAERGWASLGEVTESLAHRDAVLDGSRDHEEVVLWFEHDLYDQLQLVQVLDRFARRDSGPTVLTLVSADEYLGTLSPDRLSELFRDRREVSARESALGREAWEALRSPDPTRVLALIGKDTSALPFLGDALLRHLEQFPSAENGLSRSEAQALEAISGGRSTSREAFVASHLEREDPVFLSDAVFAAYLEDMSRVDEPLVLFEDGAEIVAPHPTDRPSDFWYREMVVTENGREVLEGRKDRIEANGIDRWLGRVHLTYRDHWRYDGSARGLLHRAG